MKKIILLIALAAIAFLAFRFAGPLFNKFERTPPTIELSGDISGLGSEPRSIKFSVDDSGTGLSSVTVTAEQSGKTVSLLQKVFEDAVNNMDFDLPVSGKDSGLKEGPAKLLFQAKDRALFENGSEASREVVVDFARPKIQILTQQFRAKEAGAEFVMYRTQDTNLEKTGVKVGAIKYPAVKGLDIDPAFANQPDLYGAIFAIPLASIGGDRKISVYSSDTAGNETLVGISLPIDPFKQAQATPKISEQFINDKIDDLMPGYEKRSGERVNPDRNSEAGLAEAFKIINEKYRAVLDKSLLDIMTRENPAGMQWKGIFIKPMPSATSSTLGEKRHYMLNNTDAGKSLHCGLDLASVENDIVRAANDGTVVLAEEFGIYGNAVVIDHGMGVYSLYGHLSSVEKNVGDKVAKADEIGRSGKTGLAGGDHLHFEIRIRGTAVSPIEWWDPKWMQDDLYGKIERVKAEIAGGPESHEIK